jgi:hypothetical protein
VLSESYCQNGLAILAQAWVNRPAFWSPGRWSTMFFEWVFHI